LGGSTFNLQISWKIVMRKKSIEELQAELALESEALATLQIIYAEKVKQVRTNTGLPPDIQARFLAEWETFYQQRVAAIFRKDYLRSMPESGESEVTRTAAPAPAVSVKPPSAPPVKTPIQQMPTPVQTPAPQPPLASAARAQEAHPADDILGVNTDSWMNSAESITYEQYNGNEPISPSLMDSDKVHAPSESLDADYADDPESIDGYAATSGLKGLTEFMDFDLKKKKS
jgi:hypothetical protein